MACVKKKKSGKQDVSDDLGAIIRVRNFKKAKLETNKALDANWDLAFQMQYLLANNKLEVKKNGKADANKLPPCCNKWKLLSIERCLDLLIVVLGKKVGKHMPLKELSVSQLRKLLCFGMCVEEGCALPTKVWEDLVAWCRERAKELGSCRMARLMFKKTGKRVEVDYCKCGPFRLDLDADASKYVSITHSNGTQVKLPEPLDLSYTISKNWCEYEAEVVSSSLAMNAKVYAFFKKASMLDKLPKPMMKDRVGSAFRKQDSHEELSEDSDEAGEGDEEVQGDDAETLQIASAHKAEKPKKAPEDAVFGEALLKRLSGSGRSSFFSTECVA